MTPPQPRWTRRATAQLREIRVHLARERDPQLARRTAEAIRDAAANAQTFPLSARIVPECEDASIREVFVSNHRIMYRVERSSITVISVFHIKRELSRDLILGDGRAL